MYSNHISDKVHFCTTSSGVQLQHFFFVLSEIVLHNFENLVFFLTIYVSCTVWNNFIRAGSFLEIFDQFIDNSLLTFFSTIKQISPVVTYYRR